MQIFDKACAEGMPPNVFWDTEVADSADWVESRSYEKKREQYDIGVLAAQMFGVVLGNAFREKGKSPQDFPKFNEMFAFSAPVEKKKPKTKEELQRERFEARKAQLIAQFGGRIRG